MLTMHALGRRIVSNAFKVAGEKLERFTYQHPIVNIAVSIHLFFVEVCRCQTEYIGKARMTKSVTTLRMLTTSEMRVKSMQ